MADYVHSKGLQFGLHIMRGIPWQAVENDLPKDARNLATLVDNAYRLNSNYKYAGMPLWNCIGSVEIAMWDLIGNNIQRPVYELLGEYSGMVCPSIPLITSTSNSANCLYKVFC